ncbi:MAG: methyltransferase [Bryobacteraceae bacterium]|nr:methyltransferase [Bryobacteraceae bacterium]
MLAGLGALLCGCGLNVWAVWMFRRGEAGVCPFSAVERVVDGGPYRFSRNPMYLGLVLISAAFVLLAGPLWNAGFAAALGVWLHLRFVLPEEEFLRERLGAAYLEYASRRARWLGL